LGITNPGYTSEKLFKPLAEVVPKNFTEKELAEVSKLIWAHRERPKQSYFDFCELEHIYVILS
jgi:hypothetical protein